MYKYFFKAAKIFVFFLLVEASKTAFLADETKLINTSTENAAELESLSAVDLLQKRQEKIEAKKIMISDIVSSILEDPQANVCDWKNQLGQMV